MLTVAFVMLAEVLIFVPSVARFRESYLLLKLEKAQIASLALLANDMIDDALEAELIENAGVFNVVLLRDEVRQLILSSPIPAPIEQTFDLRDATAFVLIRDAANRLIHPENEVIRVLGEPVRDAGLMIEITTETAPLRAAMLDYGLNILFLSAVISVFTSMLLFLAVRGFLVTPIHRVVEYMQSYAAAPEDARQIIVPTSGITELREAEDALHSLQVQLTAALKQKERLAQLGGAVAKVSHDLRNILTTAQLLVDRIEASGDPGVQRTAPKLVNSISRAVKLCEATLAFGKAEEPAPELLDVDLVELAEDVVSSEQLAVGDGNISIGAQVEQNLMVKADAEQLHRVLSNLVRNARQAIMARGQGGEITITGHSEPEEWIICVTDTGPGLPKKAVENLFVAFQGGTRKDGTGLGLTIASELVRGHGGVLELIRSDQAGTAFAIRLPRSEIEIDAN